VHRRGLESSKNDMNVVKVSSYLNFSFVHTT
jgi:hypothetical protein